MYGQDDIFNAPEYGATAGRKTLSFLTGGLSEKLRKKENRMEKEERISLGLGISAKSRFNRNMRKLESVISKLKSLFNQGKLDQAQAHAAKLSDVVRKIEQAATKLDKEWMVPDDVQAWISFGQNGDAARLARTLGLTLPVGDIELQDYSAPDYSTEGGGIGIFAPDSGQVLTHPSGIRGGVTLGPGQGAPAYTAYPPSMQMQGPMFDPGYPGQQSPINIYVDGGRGRQGQRGRTPGGWTERPRRLGRAGAVQVLRGGASVPQRQGASSKPFRQAWRQNHARSQGASLGSVKATKRARKAKMAGMPVDSRLVDDRTVDVRGVDTRTLDARAGVPGVIGADAFEMLHGGTGLAWADLFVDNGADIDDLLLDDEDEDFGLAVPNEWIDRQHASQRSALLREIADLEVKGLKTRRRIKKHEELLAKLSSLDRAAEDRDLLRDDEDEEEDFGFQMPRRDIEKSLEATRRQLELMNRKGLRDKGDHRRYNRTLKKFEHLQQVMDETRAREVPRYTDPKKMSMFSSPDELDDDMLLIDLEDDYEDLSGDELDSVFSKLSPQQQGAVKTMLGNGVPRSEVMRVIRENFRSPSGV